MSLLFRYILKEHLYPFFIALFILLFVLLTNFLLKAIDKFLGKGLSITVLVEYIILNLAWILALAVPMSVLIATLMAYGRMSSDNEITALRTCGISYLKILMPSLFFGIMITFIMIWFNNNVLPETNHKARLLSRDISRKRPDLQFDTGYFIDLLPEYKVLLKERSDNLFKDILVFNHQKHGSQRTIIAKNGKIETIIDGVLMKLSDGVIHEISSDLNDYREIYFSNYNLVIPVDNLNLKRKSSNIRSDREMTSLMIKDKIRAYKGKIKQTNERIRKRLSKEVPITMKYENIKIVQKEILKFRSALRDSLGEDDIKFIRKKRRLKNLEQGVKSDFKLIKTYEKYISKYEVELYKKYSIPFASIVFIFIGASLGIIIKKKGFGMNISLSLVFFVVYWAFLIAGEEFADKGQLSPVIAMWMPNLVLGLIGIYLFFRTSKEQKSFNLNFLNIFKKNEL